MEILGRNTIVKINDILDGRKVRRCLLFTGKQVWNSCLNIIGPFLQKYDIDLYFCSGENPKFEQIQQAIQQTSKKKYDMYIAFGGGSVIDFAKAYRYYAKTETRLLAIPTTAGTGSEVTQFAVVYIDGIKKSLDSPSILPEFAVVDSQFSEFAPMYVRACSGMDAYCHAIESFWARRATSESKKLALQSVELCRDNLVPAVLGVNKLANEKMAQAAYLAGRAINITRTTAAHALSYKITMDYGLAHGHAVGLNIAHLFKRNAPYVQDIDKLLNKMRISLDGILPYFDDIMDKMGLEYNWEKLQIKNLENIADSVNTERLANNPIPLTKNDLLDILYRR